MKNINNTNKRIASEGIKQDYEFTFTRKDIMEARQREYDKYVNRDRKSDSN